MYVQNRLGAEPLKHFQDFNAFNMLRKFIFEYKTGS